MKIDRIYLYYPNDWAQARNERAKGLNEETRTWAHRVKLIGTDDVDLARMCQEFDTESYAGWLYPQTSSRALLRIISDFVLWGTVLDDETERSAQNADEAQRQQMFDTYVSIIEGTAKDGENRYVHAFHDMMLRVREIIGISHFTTWSANFYSILKQGFRALIWDEPQAARAWQDLNFYGTVRPLSTNVLWYLPFIEIADDCPLPAQIVNSAAMQDLNKLCSLTFGLFNDILSFSKENTGRPVLNAALMHMHQRGCDERAAFDEITHWHNDSVTLFQSSAAQLRREHAGSGDTVSRYIRGVEHWMRGIAEWQLRSPRYAKASREAVVLVADPPVAPVEQLPDMDSFKYVLTTDQRTRDAFVRSFDVITATVEEDLLSYIPASRLGYFRRLLEYTCIGGKLIRGLTVVEAANILTEGTYTKEQLFGAQVLGWCAEVLQAYLLVIDDILDGSRLRRGRPCWYRLEDVGTINAINDGILLRSFVFRILKRWFGKSPNYLKLIEVFSSAAYATEIGQATDTDGLKNRPLLKYNMSYFSNLAQNKTAYYTYVLPVDLALIASNQTPTEGQQEIIRAFCHRLGEFYQAQNDMLDYYSDEQATGKEGNDIAERKCTWLLATALQCCTGLQLRTLEANYGKEDPACVAEVRAVFEQLSIMKLFADYSQRVHEKLNQYFLELEAETPRVAQVLKLLWKKSKKAGASLPWPADSAATP